MGWLGGGDRPAEAGEVTGDGDRDDRLALAALLVEPAPEVVQALLGLPGDRDDEWILTLVPALKGGADPRRAALVPSGLDH